MSRDQLTRRVRRVLDRLMQPSSAAGLAALLALMIPELADYGDRDRRVHRGDGEVRMPELQRP